MNRSLALPFPGIPSPGVLLAGAALGVAAAVAASRLRVPRTATAAAAAVGAVVALSVAADGFGARHGGIGRLASSGVVSWFAAGSPDADPVAFAPQMLGVLAGDDLRRPISMIPAGEPCSRTLRRRGWVVVGTFPLPELRQRFRAGDCLAGLRPAYRDASFSVYRLGP